MSIKKILTPLCGSPEDRHAVAHAVEIAGVLKAHVTVMHAGGHLSELVSADPPNYGRVKPQLQIDARALLAEQAEAARVEFESLVREKGLRVANAPGGGGGGTVSFDVRRGSMEAAVQEAAVFHDLVLFYRDRESAGTEALGFTVIKSALESCGRPLLVVPEKIERPFASVVAIAFNGSIEGAHAVSAALPMLGAAHSVHILTIATQKTSIEQGKHLQSYLSWHGIEAEMHTAESGSEPVGATVLHMAARVRTNLLVLGGYTHSRVRQTILGGVTHHVLRHAQIPIFLSK